MRCPPITLATLVFVLAMPALGLTVRGFAADDSSDGGIKISPISGDPDKPRRHIRIENPADLSHQEAREVYEELVDEMTSGYALSASRAAMSYESWTVYNNAPYRSVTHGQRFVNNYGNGIAAPYGDFESAGTMPAGSILAKDSFTVTDSGDVEPGPLFLMEKMPKGFNYVSGDWRYTMIMPDGEFFGETNGKRSERVEYCIECHLAREKFDHLYFIPKAVRVGN